MVAERQALENLKDTVPTCYIIKRPLGKCTRAELEGSDQIKRAEAALKAAEAARKTSEKNLENVSERRFCITKKLNGESCGVWDSIKGSLPDLDFKKTLENAKESSVVFQQYFGGIGQGMV